MAKQYICNAYDTFSTKHWRVTTLSLSSLSCPLHSRFCDTGNSSFLSVKCHQSLLTLTVKSKWSVSADKCTEIAVSFWFQILNLNVSRCSVLSVTRSKRQSVQLRGATQAWPAYTQIYVGFVWYRMHGTSWTAWWIFRTRTKTSLCSANVFKVWNQRRLEQRLCTCEKHVYVFRQDHIGNLTEYLRQSRIFADKIYVTSHNSGGYDTEFLLFWNTAWYRVLFIDVCHLSLFKKIR